MAITWNPSDKTAGITLTTTNHLATTNDGNNNGVRVTSGHSTGKWYFETFTGNNGGLRHNIGVDTAGSNLAAGSSPTGWFMGLNGLVTTPAGLGRSMTAGSPVGVWAGWAIDIPNLKGWCRLGIGGSWEGINAGAADPVAGTNPFNLAGGTSPLTGVLFCIARLFNFSGGPPTVTINCGDTAFQTAAPTGYAAWDTPVAPSANPQPVIFATQ